MEIFISYSRDDRHWVHDLWRQLREQLDHDPWIDYKLVAAEDWWETILANIERAQVFLIVLTPRSIESAFCQAELHYAQALNKPILPIMLKSCEIPQDLKGVQYLNLTGERPMHEVLIELTKSLGKISQLLGTERYGRREAERPPLPKTEQGRSANETYEDAIKAYESANYDLAQMLLSNIVNTGEDAILAQLAKRKLEEIAPLKQRHQEYVNISKLASSPITRHDARIAWEIFCEIYGGDYDPLNLNDRLAPNQLASPSVTRPESATFDKPANLPIPDHDEIVDTSTSAEGEVVSVDSVASLIERFFKARERQRWGDALGLLQDVRDTGKIPSWFDLEAYELEIGDLADPDRAERRRQEEKARQKAEEERRQRRVEAEEKLKRDNEEKTQLGYQAVKILLRYEGKVKAWEALKDFWFDRRECYDPDGIANEVCESRQLLLKEIDALDIDLQRRNLLLRMVDLSLTPAERHQSAEELGRLGDPREGVGITTAGLPSIKWQEVPAATFCYGGGTEKESEEITLSGFYMSRYPVTNIQFETFLTAKDGLSQPRWWEGVPEEQVLKVTQRRTTETQATQPSAPYVSRSWYEAVAFCRWLSNRLQIAIMLPTGQQWELATRGLDNRLYPWGNKYVPGFANLNELPRDAGTYNLGHIAIVGIYPQNASPFGILDLIGNVGEWCADIGETKSGNRTQPYAMYRSQSWANSVHAPEARGGGSSMVNFSMAYALSLSSSSKPVDPFTYRDRSCATRRFYAELERNQSQIGIRLISTAI